MILALPLLLFMAGLLCAPAYIVSRNNGDESIWLLFVSLPALLIWMSLTSFGYGAQSLSNIVEIFWILVVSVLICYMKVFIIDRKLDKPKKTTYYLMALLALAAFLSRTFMPVLPE